MEGIIMDVEKIVREYIDKTIHMSLATSKVNKPWVCEVHFVYDKDLNLYFRSIAPRRHSQEISANPSVAGNIVKQHGLGEYPHAIYFEGKAKPITSAQDREKIFPLFQERFGVGQSVLDESAQPDGHHFYKITVENWYCFGKFGGEKGQKTKLEWNGGNK